MSAISKPGGTIRMTQAQFDRLFGNKNGFSRGRLLRKIGSIPVDEYFRVYTEAEENVEEVTGKTWERYLARHAEHRCVTAIDTGSSGHIIIK